MIHLRPANERGHTKLDRRDSRHTFSFDQYYDPRYMGFRPCAYSTKTGSPPARVSPPTRTAIWKS